MPYDDQRPKVTPPHVGLAGLRKSHGLTQAAVAEQITAITDTPFNPNSLSLIEGGHRGASPEVLSALARVFKLDVADLRVDYEPSHSRRAISA